jgi:hypothetical protein
VKKLGLAVLVLVVLLLVADRAGALYASRSLADEVQASARLDEPPGVDITGFPFLTQALAGRYERIEVVATNVPTGDLVLSRVDATLHGAQVPLSDVLSRAVDDVPVEQVMARALVPYEEISQSYQGQELLVEPDGDRLLIAGELQVSDRTVAAEALASVEVVEGDLLVTPEEVVLGEEGDTQELTEAVRDQLQARVPVPQVPYDLQLTGVQVRPDGVRLEAEGTDVVLSAGPPIPSGPVVVRADPWRASEDDDEQDDDQNQRAESDVHALLLPVRTCTCQDR